jgi:hypothetical protein
VNRCRSPSSSTRDHSRGALGPPACRPRSRAAAPSPSGSARPAPGRVHPAPHDGARGPPRLPLRAPRAASSAPPAAAPRPTCSAVPGVLPTASRLLSAWVASPSPGVNRDVCLEFTRRIRRLLSFSRSTTFGYVPGVVSSSKAISARARRIPSGHRILPARTNHSLVVRYLHGQVTYPCIAVKPAAAAGAHGARTVRRHAENSAEVANFHPTRRWLPHGRIRPSRRNVGPWARASVTQSGMSRRIPQLRGATYVRGTVVAVIVRR